LTVGADPERVPTALADARWPRRAAEWLTARAAAWDGEKVIADQGKDI